MLDWVLVANEVVKEMKREKKEVIFKVDFEDAYDSIDWNFLLLHDEADGV